jgi:hypothetical protein
MVWLSQFALESIFAHPGTIKFSHDKSVYLNEIKNSPIPVSNSMEPLVLINVALDDVDLSIQNIMKMFAFAEHRQPKPSLYFVKSSHFLRLIAIAEDVRE